MLLTAPHHLTETTCECCAAETSMPVRDARWLADARQARWLAWASLAWMSLEGIVGLTAGLAAGSIALAGWAAGSVIEGLASIIVIWRFTGARALAESTEERAQKAVAVSFWLLVPWITAGAIYDLAGHHPASTTVIGLVVTASSVIIMPALGLIKHRLGRRLNSGATAGEGTQNLICAAQAAAVLTGLAIVAAWPAGWAADPLIALAIAGWSGWEGRRAWQGADCC